MAKKSVQTLANIGAGPPPGYQWSVVSLQFVRKERAKLFTELESNHIADVVRQLAKEESPPLSELVDVRGIEDFYEIRDKGGPLGTKNVRVFFGLDKEDRSIVLLGAILKQNNGNTPLGDIIRIRRRWRLYQAGDFES